MKKKFDSIGSPVVALHLRRGDYGTGPFFRTPIDWCLTELTRLREELGECAIYLASDSTEEVLPHFTDFECIACSDLNDTGPDSAYISDWIAISLADIVLISNSSFSFSASMFNNHGRVFRRPSLEQGGFIDFQPWNSPVLLRGVTAEKAGSKFMSPRALSRTKYRVGRLLGYYPKKNIW